jgi:hydroxyacid-oxoacid transhydrogenase
MIMANARIQRQTDSSSSVFVPSEKAIRDQPGEALSNELLELMYLLKIPIGIRSLGYDEGDIESLARGTLPQHRVTKLSPRQPIGIEELEHLFTDALDG